MAATSQDFSAIGSAQYFTAGQSGFYDIVANGGQGGKGYSGAAGGLGAMAQGEIYLASGAKLEIVVGSAGGDTIVGDGGGAGGGGGSFVIEVYNGTTTVNTDEIIAGGGGGAGSFGAGGGAEASNAGASGVGAGHGTGGGADKAGTGGTKGGGGGGGFTGGNGAIYSANAASGETTGSSFAGGLGIRSDGQGGYGGGGGGGTSGGGGGGGYGGGGGGGHDGGSGGVKGTGSGGGGGGSYVNTSAVHMSSVVGATNSGAGSVDVTFVSSAACYLAGTLILTDRGEVAVETLAIGDFVVTAAGAKRPIKWIGVRAYSARFVRNSPDLQPIVFHVGSLSDNSPARDLYVSPRHAMFLDGALIPAERLVNGVSIRKSRVDGDVHYFHIELESHDLLLAEGAPSESFIDDDSRGLFQNAHTFGRRYPGETPAAVSCAPRVEDGELLERVLRRLVARAGFHSASSKAFM